MTVIGFRATCHKGPRQLVRPAELVEERCDVFAAGALPDALLNDGGGAADELFMSDGEECLENTVIPSA